MSGPEIIIKIDQFDDRDFSCIFAKANHNTVLICSWIFVKYV